MRRIWLVIICLVWLAPLPAAARTLLVIGDSLSAAYGMDAKSGWVVLLQKRLAQENPDYRVINASISGDTTANGLARLPRLLTEHKPVVVIIELGGNDGLRGQSLEQMKHNITAMITKAKDIKARVLLAGVRLPPNYGPAYAGKFQQVYQEVAREQRVALVPDILDDIATNGALMLQDRIHPNAEAQARVLENIWPHLHRLL
ncbi:MAG TPA: arylesterase [Sulfuricaulis sp.]